MTRNRSALIKIVILALAVSFAARGLVALGLNTGPYHLLVRNLPGITWTVLEFIALPTDSIIFGVPVLIGLLGPRIYIGRELPILVDVLVAVVGAAAAVFVSAKAYFDDRIFLNGGSDYLLYSVIAACGALVSVVLARKLFGTAVPTAPEAVW